MRWISPKSPVDAKRTIGAYMSADIAASRRWHAWKLQRSALSSSGRQFGQRSRPSDENQQGHIRSHWRRTRPNGQHERSSKHCSARLTTIRKYHGEPPGQTCEEHEERVQ
eukprot:3470255-Pyramimonas_sp.AAC.1